MGTVTGLTAERMLAIEAASVVDGEIDESGHLILTKHDGTEIDAGNALVAVPDENIVHLLDSLGYTEDTPPASYPTGISVLALNNIETAADWPSFSGKYYSIHSINYPGNDVTQVAQRLHGSTTIPERWIRSGNFASGWSEWGQGIPDSSVQGSAIIPSSLGGSRLAVRTVTYDKMASPSITAEKTTFGNDVNLIPDPSFVHGDWRAARLDQLPPLGSFITPAAFGTWSFSGAGTPHISGTFKVIANVTGNDQKISLASPIPCNEGDVFTASFWVYGESAPNAACLMGFRWFYPDGTTTLSNGPVANSFSAPTSWTMISEQETVPAGAIAVVPHFEIQAASGTPTGKWNMTKPLLRRFTGGLVTHNTVYSLSTTFGTTETSLVVLNNVTFQPGRAYRIYVRGRGYMNTTGSNGDSEFRIRRNSLTGLELAHFFDRRTGSSGYRTLNDSAVVINPTTTTIGATLLLTGFNGAGAGIASFEAAPAYPAGIEVHDIGLASVWPGAMSIA